MKSKALKAGMWYIISNFLTKGIAFISMPFFTRLMTKGDIGSFSNITSWFTILAIITTFEIYSSVSIARFDYKEDLDSYISSTLFLGTLITGVFYIIVLIFRDFFQNLFLVDFKTLNIIFIYLLVYPSVQMFQIRNQIKYNYIPTIVISIINTVFSTGISLLLVLIMDNKLDGRIYGYFIPLIIISILVYIYLLVKGKSVSKKYWKYALKISFPLIWHLLAGYLLSSADRIMITKMISTEANALYSIPYSISIVVSILWSSMNNAWSPWAYEMMDKKYYTKLKDNSKPYTIAFIIIVFLLMLLTPEILLLMGGNGYVEAKYVMPPVMIGYIFQFIYSLYVNIEFYHKKQKNIAFGTIIAALINIGLNFIFIPIFGYIAAAYTTLIGYIALFFIHYFLVKKLNCTYWYDTKFFAKVLTFSIIYMIVCNLLYGFTYIRLGVLSILSIVIIMFCIKKHKDLIRIIKNRSFDELKNFFRKGKDNVE